MVFTDGGSCPANTIVISFAKVSPFRLLFRPHRQPPNNLLVFTGSFYHRALRSGEYIENSLKLRVIGSRKRTAADPSHGLLYAPLSPR